MKSMIAFIKKANSIGRKVFIVLIAYAIIIVLFTRFSGNEPANPAPSALEQSRTQIYKNLQNKKMQSTKSGREMLALYRLSNCSLIGEACTDNPSDGDKNFEKSFFGFLVQGVTLAYRAPPASGVYWVSNGLQNAGFIPKSYAAEGIGFGSIRPISGLWEKMRNFALIVTAFVLVTIGFLIMFRVKINPQTVINVENSLPRIFVSLILIIFSFAIAGFLIDLMYIVTALAITVLDKDALKNLLTGNTGKLFNEVFWNGNILELGPDIFSILPNILGQSLRLIIAAIATFGILKIPPVEKMLGLGDGIPFLEGLLKVSIAALIPTALFIAIQPTVPYVLSIIILVTGGLVVFFRIVILLIAAYVRIILMIIFAPIILLLEAIPGRKMLMYWLKNLVADLSAFIITAVLIVVSGQIVNTSGNGNLWQPPFLYTVGSNAFPGIIGMAILFAIPGMIKKWREMLGIKPSGIFGPSLFFTGAGAGAGGAGGIAHKFMDFRYKAGYLPGFILEPLQKLPGFKTLGQHYQGRPQNDDPEGPAKTGQAGGGGN